MAQKVYDMHWMMSGNAASLESFYSMYDKYSLTETEIKEIKYEESKLQEAFPWTTLFK